MTSDSPPRFAHDSEAELARILDFYGVAWCYEPDVFPISWNADGAVVESFAPDFYLPEADLYVELTTLKQSLVRKKNRKLRRLRELYPDVHIKLFYARDFRALMLKYGKLALADALTGTAGQSGMPVAPAATVPIEPGLAATVIVLDAVGDGLRQACLDLLDRGPGGPPALLRELGGRGPGAAVGHCEELRVGVALPAGCVGQRCGHA